ncbi:hypothetical protein FHS31_002976 [Sphingomonas vulcanisoli]|uniref:Uncharacterized protein n=1 Tax=Sphingomonas vulcanisoli TaxID=1658060 RepID=A0ABX0TX98_9SPHN|nr:hypothetical protein [Sphingomonas vulcanisoli]
MAPATAAAAWMVAAMNISPATSDTKPHPSERIELPRALRGDGERCLFA